RAARGHRACRRARSFFRAGRALGCAMTLLTIVFQNPSPSPAGAAGAGIFSSPILLSLLIWIPVLAAAAIATMPNPRGRYDTLMKQIAFFTNLGLVFVLVVAYYQCDMFLLVLFWGASAIPLTLLVLGWGGPRRNAAAWRLLGYWGLGTGVLAAGVLALYAVTGAQSFDMDTLLKAGLSPRIQIAVSLVMIVAAATRLPLFPLHGWMRDVLAEAPPGVLVVVAGPAARPGAL